MMSPTSQASEPELPLATIKGKWEEVVKIYEEEKDKAWLAVITNAKDTALHMAISEEKEDIVEKLVSIIMKGNRSQEAESVKNALKAKNESGDTPLHRAAAGGSVKMCKYIVEAGQNMGLEKQDLLIINNNWGQNPIMVATLNNRIPSFFYLIFKAAAGIVGLELDQLLRGSGNGDTVLHAAIQRDSYDLAFCMIKHFPNELLDKRNAAGMTPLHVLASKPSAFKSGYHLTWWKKIIYYCVYYSIHVEPLKYDPNGTTTDMRSSNPDKYLKVSGEKQTDVDPENPNSSDVMGNIPRNYETCFPLLATVFRIFVNFLGFVRLIKNIKGASERHKRSIQLLDEILKHPAKAYPTKYEGALPPDYGEELSHFLSPPSLVELKEKGDHKENQKDARNADGTALLVAAKNGVVEVVEKILQQLPLAIHDTSSMKNKNIMLIAAENKKPRILYTLRNHLTKKSKEKLWDDLVQAVDTDGNTMLHLAAYCDDKGSHAWQIAGSALQMQRETKWYKYVSSLVPAHYAYLVNQKGETPWQTFTAQHRTLVKESGKWLKDTSESCSVVAALVAGVTFATASQVPGGTKGDTGKPNLEGDPAFELCAVSALIGLCFSITSLIMFLSILTSRKQHKDFKVDLPLKLLLGLSSLFVSIASMLISFCAAYFFVLNDKFQNGLYPLYVVTCFPLTIYAIAQFPLYWDLLTATISIVPQLHNLPRLLSAVGE